MLGLSFIMVYTGVYHVCGETVLGGLRRCGVIHQRH
jgi:hypothetical protein